MRKLGQPFNALAVTNENTIQDQFGHSLNVSDAVLIGGGTGRIIAYDNAFFKVARLDTATDGTKFVNANLAPVPPRMLTNVRSLYNQQTFDDEEQLYGTHYDHTPSEKQKCSKKYVVTLVTDLGPHHNQVFRHSPILDDVHMGHCEILISTLYGSTEAVLEEFIYQLEHQHQKRVLGWLSNVDTFVHGRCINLVSTHWTVFNAVYRWNGDDIERRVSSALPTLAQMTLSRKHMTEIGLMGSLDVIMSIPEFNEIMTDPLNKMELR